MNPRLLLSATLLAAALFAMPARAAEFTIDPAHSRIGFAVRHMVIATVRGHFGEFASTLTFNPDAVTPVSAVNATIKTASIDTANAQRDAHLRQPDFFHVEEHPELKFVSESIVATGEHWVARGKLTIRGVTKDVALPFKVSGPIKDPWGKTRLGIEARITIDRREYDLTWSKALETGGLVVGNEVQIVIEAEYLAAE